MPKLHLNDITITRHPVSGAWLVSAIVGEGAGAYLLRRTYIGYTKQEAIRLFREEAHNA